MKTKLKTRILFLLLMILYAGAEAQTGTEFWFGAPDVSSMHGTSPANGAPIYLNLTAQYPTQVTISRPADPSFIPLVMSLGQNEITHIRLDGLLSIDQIETYPQPDLVNGAQEKGFLIQASPGEITASYELDNYYNREIFSLKGKRALGKEFYVSTQNYYDNGDYSGTAWSGFVIVATEDNTTVTVQQNENWLYFPVPATRVFILNRGETFAFRAESRLGPRHINGVHVSSDKDIAITIYDDSLINGGSRDIIGDQIEPMEYTGKEYIVQCGYLSQGERVFISFTASSTLLIINGIPKGLYNAGDTTSYILENEISLIQATENIYVNHITGFGTEVGGALLPSVDDCFGHNAISFSRSVNASDNMYLRLLVRNDTISGSPFKNQSVKNFELVVSGFTYSIPETFFEFIQDSAYAVLKDEPVVNAYFQSNIPAGQAARIQNANTRFHLSLLQGGAATGAKYAWLTGSETVRPSAGISSPLGKTQEVICGLDSVQLVAQGGTHYFWNSPTSSEHNRFFSDTSAAAPWFLPTETGAYFLQVTISDDCNRDTTISILLLYLLPSNADFSISETQACGELTTTLTNLSDPAINERMIWIFENPEEEINQDTLPGSFERIFPPNTSDTLQNYPISLYAWRNYYTCPSVKHDTVTILPGIRAGFSLNDTIACSPFTPGITNTSIGLIESYFWDSGSGATSTDISPVFTYISDGPEDTILILSLSISSAYGCTDTASQRLHIMNRKTLSLVSQDWEGCSPFSLEMEALGVDVEDSISWQFFFSDGTEYLIKDSVRLTQTIENLLSETDTTRLKVSITKDNGCSNTAEKTILVYPQVTADFVLDYNDILYPVGFTTTNNSIHATEFLWDFGDGTFSREENTSHSYLIDRDTSYSVQLFASSEHCADTAFEYVYVQGPNGLIDMQEAEYSLKAYFNQGQHILHLEYLGAEPITIQGIAVFSIHGSLIDNQDTRIIMDRGDRIVHPVRGLSQGNVYFIQIRFDGQTSNLKILYP